MVHQCSKPSPSDSYKPNGNISCQAITLPHVSGVMALLLAAFPAAPAEAVIKAVRDTAKHPEPDRRPDNRWGHGVVQIKAAHDHLKDSYPPLG